MEDWHLNLDYDGTMTEKNNVMELARQSGMQDHAYAMARQLFHDSEKAVDESITIDGLVDKIEYLYRKQVENGAMLLKGVTLGKVLEIECRPNSRILKKALDISDGRPVNVFSYNDERIIRKFARENGIPVRNVNGSILDDYDGVLTGKLRKMPSKSETPAGPVFVNDVGDIGMIRNASRGGYDIFVVHDGIRTELVEKILRKYDVRKAYFL